MNAKGGINWFALIMIPTLIIIMIPVAVMIDVVVQVLFTALDSTTNLHYIGFIKLLAGSITFIMMLVIVWNVGTSIKGPDASPPDFSYR